jgi:uncharacterized membrane protein
VATFRFGGTAEPAPLDSLSGAEPRTRLFESLDDVLASFAGTPLAAVVVVSDGAHNGAGEVDLADIRAAGVPVHAIGVGPEALPGEVRLTDVVIPADAAPESRVAGELVLRHRSAGSATVRVRDGGRLLAAERVELDPRTPVQRLSVGFDSGPGGIRELTFEVEPPPGDGFAENNRLERLLTVNDRRRRVLYLEGAPRWEYKFIRRAVGGDEVLNLTSWLRTTGRKTYRQGVADPAELASGFPGSRAELYRYDVLVLGSLAATALDDRQHGWLADFVSERGGSLLALAGGQAFGDGGWDVRPLADVLPVRLSRENSPAYVAVEGAVRVTPAGSRSPMTELIGVEGGDPWSSLPPLADHHRVGALKPAATSLLDVLVDGERRPLLVVQPYGLGTAAVLATASTWRWQMRTPPDDQRHTLFWRQLLRQLAETAQQPRDVSLSVADETLSVRLVARDEEFSPLADPQARATVFGPGLDGAELPLTASTTAGVFAGGLALPAAGVYRVDVAFGDGAGSLTRFVRAGAEHAEHAEPAQNPALLRRLAEATGGRYWPLHQAHELDAALGFASAGVRQRELLPLWDMPVAFLLLVALKAGEWLLRRRWGWI